MINPFQHMELAGGYGFNSMPFSGFMSLNKDADIETPVTGANPRTQSLEHYHETVLLEEATDALKPCEGKVLVDGTLGGGGHTERLLEQGAKVYSIDRDPAALAYAKKRLIHFGEQFQPIQGNFSDMESLMKEQGIDFVDGILVDIGVSSHQFDAAERGFSFSKGGPLDMRMGPSCLKTAADIVNNWDADALAKIFRQYGEEKSAWKIATHIVEKRLTEPFETTIQLAEAIEKILPRFGKKIHPATKVFQALRIEVNDELGALNKLLESAKNILKPGGRFAVISFHSLEDRMVKHHFRETSKPEIDRPEWPAPRPNPDYAYQQITRKPIVACSQEVARNSRSRSALLRIVERVNN